jgi:alpha-L-fucosidase
MRYKFEKVVESTAKWLGDSLYPKMNDIQELIARMVIGRALENEEQIKTALASNGVLKTFNFIDDEGTMDVEELFSDLMREIERKGKLVLNIPLIGKITFTPEDVENLKNYITVVEYR